MSATSSSAKAEQQTDKAPTFRGHRLKELTTTELAEICIAEARETGEPPVPPTIRELVDMRRAGVRLKLSSAGEAFAAAHKANFDVLKL